MKTLFVVIVKKKNETNKLKNITWLIIITPLFFKFLICISQEGVRVYENVY